MVMYTERELNDGTRVYFAKPSTPVAPGLIAALSHALAEISGIIEAHLPQYYAEGDAKSRLVLIIGVHAETEIAAIIPRLAEELKTLIPAGEELDILPFAAEAIPAAVRATQCRIFETAIR